MTTRRVMIVDDEPAILSMVATILIAEGYTISKFTDASYALDVLRVDPRRPDVVLIDLWLPELDGDLFCQRVASLGLDIPCVLMSAASDVDEHGAYLGLRVLRKPFDVDQLLDVVEHPRLEASEAAL